MATIALLILPAACVTPAPSDAGADASGDRTAATDRERPDRIGDLLRSLNRVLPADPAEGGPSLPPPATFVGQPIATLEARLGAPALVRKEGANEWRRYDLGPCRAYAVVVPAGGKVANLSTGPAIAGAPVPRFENCRPPAPGS